MSREFIIPAQCQYILDKFKAAGFSAYLVGGCVRDILLGKEPKDWDVCTSALPEQTIEVFAGEKVILTGLQHGTVALLRQGMIVEITTYRIDGVYEDNRRPKEVFFSTDLQEDLSRRDFTINALAYHPDEGVVDCFAGQEDLAQGILRCVGQAAARYQEDGLRIMRAVRFACRFNFAYEDETREGILQYSHLLTNIARERIQAEFNQIMLSNNVRRGVQDLAELNCFLYFLPQIEAIYDSQQQRPLDEVSWEKMLQALEKIDNDLVLRLSVLLYFIGQGKGLPPKEMSNLAARILTDLHYDNQTMKQVVRLLEWIELELSEDEYLLRKGLSILDEKGLHQLIQLKCAVNYQQAVENQDEMNNLMKKVEVILQNGDCYSLKQMAVKGSDLLKLGYKGVEVGKKLQELLEIVLHNPSLNTKDYLLQKCEK